MKTWTEYRIVTVQGGRHQVMPQTPGIPPITDLAAAHAHRRHVLAAGIVTEAYIIASERFAGTWQSLDPRYGYRPVDDAGAPLVLIKEAG